MTTSDILPILNLVELGQLQQMLKQRDGQAVKLNQETSKILHASPSHR